MSANSLLCADIIAATLHAYGVRHAFGIPGNDVLELIRACEEHNIRFTLAKSEPAAAFMADAVYQVSGQPAVLITALGPGVANAVSGIAGALMERSAVIVLGGEMPSNRQDVYNHQVFDHCALLQPVTKYAAELNPQRAGQQVAKALDIALSYPPGPVYLNCPADASRQPADKTPAFRPGLAQGGQLSSENILQLEQRLAAAQRPLALIGRGALYDSVAGPLQNFIERWDMPFLATYKAKGIVSDYAPQCLGSMGLSPVIDTLNSKLIKQADCLALIGFDPIELRDAWLDAWPEDKPCLSLDWGLLNHRIFPVGEQYFGELPVLLEQLTPATSTPSRWPELDLAQHRTQIQYLTRAREPSANPSANPSAGPSASISPAALFHTIDRKIESDWLLTIDVGAHRILANHIIRCHQPGQLIQSNGLGCMGYAIPAAIGAHLAEPDKPIVALLGDGCALMSLGELALAAELDAPIIIIVLNDNRLALIDLKQNKLQMERRAVEFRSPRFDQLAEGFGAVGVAADTLADFTAALEQALATRQLTIIDAKIDPAEYWEQM